MTITLFAFYLFSITAVMSALFVVVARNPVHSVLWLILTFFSAASLFVLMGASCNCLRRSSSRLIFICCYDVRRRFC